MKNLFIVKNITSGEVSSPAVYRKDAVLGGETYSLLKKDGEDLPTGDYVYQLSEKECLYVMIFESIKEQIKSFVLKLFFNLNLMQELCH